MNDSLAEHDKTDNMMVAWQQAHIETVSANPHQSYGIMVSEKMKRILLHLKYIQQFFLLFFVVPKYMGYNNNIIFKWARHIFKWFQVFLINMNNSSQHFH